MSSADCPLACIDLSNPDRQAVALQIRKACIDCGFFYVINHGVEQKLFDLVFEQSRRFFALPQEEKMKLVLNESHRGYTPVQAEALDPSVQPQGDWKESFYIGPECSETSGAQKTRFHGPNQWPSNELLPQWREIMQDYYANVLNVGRRLVTLVSLALNLEEAFFNKPGMMDEPLAFARLLHYPRLQICRNKDVKPQNWEDIPPLKGAFVINIGDMLERWSNCLFRSTLHRVVTNGHERYSVAFFLDPNGNCLVKCLPTCCNETNPPRFSPIRSGDYLHERIRMTYGLTS